jgi:hypothetical protein
MSLLTSPHSAGKAFSFLSNWGQQRKQDATLPAFGFIKYATADKNNKDEARWMDQPERHPLSFVRGSPMEGNNDTAQKAEAVTVVDNTNTLTPPRARASASASVSPAQELFP